MEIFNNREISTLIWGTMTGLLFLRNKKFRASSYDVFTAFRHHKILLTLALASLYITCCVLLLKKCYLWDLSLLKDTILWGFCVAFSLLLKLSNKAQGQPIFKNILIENFKIAIIFEFIVNYYTFPLYLELIFVPLTIIVTLVFVISEGKSKYKKVNNFFLFLLIIIGTTLTIHSVFKLSNNFSSFFELATFRSFSLPLVLLAFFIPFLYAFSLYITYESFFFSLNTLIPDNKLRKYSKTIILWKINFKTNLLKPLARDISLRRPSKPAELKSIMKNIIRYTIITNNPPPVLYRDGWSPYTACKYLEDNGLTTNDYHEDIYINNRWVAASDYKSIGNKPFTNNIAYYIEGNKDYALILKLVLNIYDINYEKISVETFSSAIAKLYLKSIGSKINLNYIKKINSKTAFSFNTKYSCVQFFQETYDPGKMYTVYFTISHHNASMLDKNT